MAAVIVERGFAGTDFLVRDVLKEAGDAVVLDPADARDAVRDAAEAIARTPTGRAITDGAAVREPRLTGTLRSGCSR